MLSGYENISDPSRNGPQGSLWECPITRMSKQTACLGVKKEFCGGCPK